MQEKRGYALSTRDEEQIDQLAEALDHWSRMLNALRVRAGLQQKQLARMLDASPTNASRWLSGHKILVQGGASLPSIKLTEAVIRHLAPTAEEASHLAHLADRIHQLQTELASRYTNWRQVAKEHLLKTSHDASPSSVTSRSPQHPFLDEPGHQHVPVGLSAATDDLLGKDTDGVADAPISDGNGGLGLSVQAPPERTDDRQALQGAEREGQQPTQFTRPAEDQQPPAPSEKAGKKRTSGQTNRRRGLVTALGAFIAVAIAATAITTMFLRSNAQPDKTNENGAFGPAQTPTTESNASSLEKDTLGKDSRCSVLQPGPDQITWRVCTRVEDERISFALKVTNSSKNTSTVKVNLQYVQARKFNACPGEIPRLLEIPAGQTIVTNTRQCAVPRQNSPYAYQASGCVIASTENACSYKLSPTAHVYPDTTKWQPDII